MILGEVCVTAHHVRARPPRISPVTRTSMRMAHRDGRARSSQGQAGVGRDDEDGQDRHRRVAGGICWNDGGARAGSLMPEVRCKIKNIQA
jgi:hypothetical protein